MSDKYLVLAKHLQGNMALGVLKSAVLLLLQLIWVTGEEKGRIEIEKEILENMFLTNKFHIYVRPYKTANGTSDEPLEVSISLYILNLDIDVKNQECSITMYFRQEWNDSRLSYIDKGKIGVLNVHDAVGFWTPDLFFVNEKIGHLHTLTKPNTFVRIYPSGRVLYSQRISFKFACSMDLRKYPFDTQICILPIESYGYTARDLLLKWKPEMTIGSNEPYGFNVFYVIEEKIIHVGENNYSRLALGIHFSRQIYPELIHVYIPLGLLVFTSWISFYFRPSAQLPRCTTVFITFFSTLQFLQSVKEFHYSQCYLTGSDVWIGFSSLLIFAAIFENVYIMANNPSSPSEESKIKKELLEVKNSEKEKRKLIDFFAGRLPFDDSNLDAIARMTFPSVFVLFNIIYLAYYLI